MNATTTTAALIAALEPFARLRIATCLACDGSGRRDPDSNDACHRCGGIGEIVDGTVDPNDVQTARAALALAQPQPSLI